MNYREYLDKLVARNEICNYCDELVQTLHHKNENRDDNSKHNLLPVCFECHEKIPHKRSIYDY